MLDEWLAGSAYRGLFAAELPDWPATLSEPLNDRHLSAEWLADGYGLVKVRDDLLAEVRRAGLLPTSRSSSSAIPTTTSGARPVMAGGAAKAAKKSGKGKKAGRSGAKAGGTAKAEKRRKR